MKKLILEKLDNVKSIINIKCTISFLIKQKCVFELRVKIHKLEVTLNHFKMYFFNF